MARRTGESTRETQALVNSVRSITGGGEIDNINEALLTMKERFADARVSGAGPLIGLIEDFGLSIDLQADSSRAQLANFLEEVGKLSSANERIFALKDVLGDQDSVAFQRVINDTEKLKMLINELNTDITQLPDVMSGQDVENVNRATEASKRLSLAWDKFATETYLLVVPVLTGITNLLAGMTSAGAKAIKFVKDLFGVGSGFDVATTEDGLIKQLDNLYGQIFRVSGAIDEMESKELFGRNYAANQSAISRKQAELEKLIVQVNQVGDALEALKLKDTPLTKSDPITTVTKSSNVVEEFKTIKIEPFEVKGIDLIARQVEDAAAIYNAQMERSPLEVPKALKETEEQIALVNKQFDAMGKLTANVSSLLGTLGGSFAKTKEQARLFIGIQQVVAVASAYAGAVQSLADIGTPSPLQKIAAYSSVLATGLAGVSAIESAGKKLGASTQSAGASGVSSSGAASTAIGGTVEAESRTRTAGTLDLTVESNGSAVLFTEENLAGMFDELTRRGYFDSVNINVR